MLSKGIILLHENALPHRANQTHDLIGSHDWEQFDHPLYSPDPEPSDYQTQDLIRSLDWEQFYHLLYGPNRASSDCHLFLHLKMYLGGQCHDDDDAIQTSALQWLSNQCRNRIVKKFILLFKNCTYLKRHALYLNVIYNTLFINNKKGKRYGWTFFLKKRNQKKEKKKQLRGLKHQIH